MVYLFAGNVGAGGVKVGLRCIKGNDAASRLEMNDRRQAAFNWKKGNETRKGARDEREGGEEGERKEEHRDLRSKKSMPVLSLLPTCNAPCSR